MTIYTAADVHELLAKAGSREASEETEIKGLWASNKIQFARLLAEINATQTIDFAALMDSMNLSQDNILELFDRAELEWCEIKRDIFGQ